jgi:hypothetical protein
VKIARQLSSIGRLAKKSSDFRNGNMRSGPSLKASLSTFGLLSGGAIVGSVLSVLLGLSDVTRAHVTVIVAVLVLVVFGGSGQRRTSFFAPSVNPLLGQVSGSRFRAVAWLTFGFCLCFSIALSTASMRASPLGDLLSPGGVAVAVGALILLIWFIWGFRNPDRRSACTVVLMASAVGHLSAYTLFSSELDEAEKRLAVAVVNQAQAALDAVPSTFLASYSVGVEEVNFGTLQLKSNAAESRFDFLWSRKSIWARLLDSDNTVPVATFWVGVAEKSTSHELQFRGLATSAEKPSTTRYLVRLPEDAARVDPGSYVLIQRTREPMLRIVGNSSTLGHVKMHSVSALEVTPVLDQQR